MLASPERASVEGLIELNKEQLEQAVTDSKATLKIRYYDASLQARLSSKTSRQAAIWSGVGLTAVSAVAGITYGVVSNQKNGKENERLIATLDASLVRAWTTHQVTVDDAQQLVRTAQAVHQGYVGNPAETEFGYIKYLGMRVNEDQQYGFAGSKALLVDGKWNKVPRFVSTSETADVFQSSTAKRLFSGLDFSQQYGVKTDEMGTCYFPNLDLPPATGPAIIRSKD